MNEFDSVFYQNVGRRLRELRTQNGFTLEYAAKRVGTTPKTIQRYEKGERKIGERMLRELVEYLGGDYDAFISAARAESAMLDPVELAPRRGVSIPVLGTVAAGIPIEAVEDILDYEEIAPEMAVTGDFFALKIKGSSMEPRMLDGDVVIVRQQEDVDNGDIAVVLVNGNEATVKKIRKQADGLSLVPINPVYDIMFYTPEECRQLPVRIIGKVVELRGKL